MLVIISDLHLTDGTCGETVPAGAFVIFGERLQELAHAASWRIDGRYQPIDRIDLVLLGDVLDVIRSAQWTAHDRLRPWSNAYAPEFVELVGRITAGVLDHNVESLDVLRGLSQQGAVRIPPANGRGQPVYDAPEQPIPVRIHYLVGNHDWFFHVRGAGYDAVRQLVVERLGLAHAAEHPFAHDPAENPELHDVQRAHRLLARHGDIYDPFNFEGDRDTSSLGDAIVVELLNRFALQVQQELGEDLPDSALAGLREIDNVRPLLLVPVWIDGLLDRTCPMPSLRKQVKLIWDRLADEFLELDFVRQRDGWGPTDLVDGLQRALKFSQRLSIGWASSIVTWLQELRCTSEETYYQHALKEQDFRNRRATHLVYGHTHTVECVPLDSSVDDGRVLNQIYFNSGTWRRVHTQTRLAPAEHEFIAQDVMTYLAFFRGDERRGRSYETWSGTLAASPTHGTYYRIDPGHGRAGDESTGQRPTISAPAVRGHAPHFHVGTGVGRIVPTRRVG
jgi:UDP-2,3-diacylglucosamine pyrophosphatase LpxH